MKFIVVYNANTGLFNSVHKFISPNKTYTCNLCSLTHNYFKENDLWKPFKERSNIELEFYHKDEF